MYYLHREFVDPPGYYYCTKNKGEQEHFSKCSALLCGFCFSVVKIGIRPAKSLANGLDFGDHRRLGILPLTPVENVLISPERLYCIIYKFCGANADSGVQPTMRGQCICFKQPTAITVTTNVINERIVFPNIDIESRINLIFVGPKNQFE